MRAVRQAPAPLPKAPLCRALGVSRATLHRRRKTPARQGRAPDAALGAGPETGSARAAAPSHRALSRPERQAVLDALHAPRFVDKAPSQVYAALLDEGVYLCSVRTMYRLLEANGEVRERRNQLRHPRYAKPQLLATCPNQVWSWDITKLLGPAKWTYFYLYVILDIFSRYAVGWMVAARESAALAKRLVEETCSKHAIDCGRLTLHADRGPSMKSKPLALLLADLGVAKSHSRPRVSNDNPFSESQFKTLKYRPEFPDRFGSIQDARAFCQRFFPWYNAEHYHSALGLLTPEMVHYHRTPEILDARGRALRAAYQRNPERFPAGQPQPPAPPGEVWINPPQSREERIEFDTKFRRDVSQKG